MPLVQVDLNGSPYLGVFARASDRHVLAPPAVPSEQQAELARALGVEVTVMTLGGANILGSVIAMNSRGALVADFADDEDLARLEALGLRVARLSGKFNAAGNNVLCNDRGAYVNADFSKAAERTAADVLDVPVQRGTLAGLKTVGSAACVTTKGLLVHPKSTDEEIDRLESLFGVDADIGTVNHGAPFIGAGLAANANGAIAGTLCTGPELNRIENALNLI